MREQAKEEKERWEVHVLHFSSLPCLLIGYYWLTVFNHWLYRFRKRENATSVKERQDLLPKKRTKR